VLDIFGQRQEKWAGQVPAGTRDMGWTMPSRDDRYELNKAQQRQEIWAGHLPAETRDNGWTSPSRDKR
jgi:hypothetical protein